MSDTMLSLLQSNLEQAQWALRRFVGNDDYVTIIAGALTELHITAAALAIYEKVGDRMDVDLLGLTQAVRTRIRESTSAIEPAVADQTLPGLRVHEDDPGAGDLLPPPSQPHTAEAVAAH